MIELDVDGRKLKITNPDKMFWPNLKIRKIDYIKIMIELGPYILPHAKDRLLMCIRYPDGIDGKYFYQKNAPAYTPRWIKKHEYNGNWYIVIDSMAAFIWLLNQATLEFHTSFNTCTKPDSPTSIVFDLDPSIGQDFNDVVEAALIINETLTSLNVKSWVKTSGATGLQIYIPTGGKYDYDTARKINEFFGRYFSTKYPDKFSIERMVKKRSGILYFDYLQMWQGKTITMVYSPRANKWGNVSMPVGWDELMRGIRPENFNLLNAGERIKKTGDLFAPIGDPKHFQNLDHILKHLE